jgi:hypothetical protein
MRLKPTKFPIALFIAAALLSPPAWSQFESATVIGNITDPSGAAVQGARVTVTSVQTKVERQANTGADGAFEFGNLRVGSYTIQVEAAGFQAAHTEVFELQTNARQRVDLALRLGAVTESVEVTGSAALLETDTSSRGVVVGMRQIAELPLNGRSYADLTLLVPGVAASPYNNHTQFQRDASFSVNGQQSTFNNFLLDGVDNNAYSRSNQGYSNQIVQPSPDALAEFKLETNNYSAEYGRSPGAVINATIRSGSNELHGAAWEFLRNTSLNAVGFFQPAGGVKPSLVQNQFGGALGGPIRRNKVFFFGDYEGFRQVQRTATFVTIPTTAMASGNLGTPVKNPITGTLYPNGLIPTSDISSFARQVLAGLPAPNLPGNANNYESMPRAPWSTDKGDVRYDYYISSKVTFFARYSQSDTRLFSPGGLPGPTPDAGATGNVYYRNKQGVAGLTWTVTPRSVLEVRFSGANSDAGKTPVGWGDTSTQFGIPNMPTNADVAGGVPTSQFSGGLTVLGRQPTSPAISSPRPLDTKLNYAWILGRHSLKFGYEHQSIATADRSEYPEYGWDIYAGLFSDYAVASPNALQQQVFSLADFMFGARYTYWLSNDVVMNLRQAMHFGYVQDDWRVNRRLTLNLGLRYEFATPEWEQDNRLTNYDPATHTLIAAKDGSIFDRSLVHPDKNNWAPRLGLALQLRSSTVLRAGYGINYIHFNRGGAWNLLAYNGPAVVSTRVIQSPAMGICASADTAAGACFRPTYMGYPANFATPATYSTAANEVHYIAPDFRAPYVQTWHMSVQQQLAKDWLLELGYVGNHSVGLILFGDRNQAVPNQLGQNLSLQARRPIPTYSTILQTLNAGFGSYHALQVKLEKRYSQGLTLLSSFTWSKAIDNVPDYIEASGSASMPIVNYNNIAADRSVSAIDQPINSTTSILYELPFGKGKRFAKAGPLLNAIVGGWSMNLQNTMSAGLPQDVTYSPTTQAQASTYLAARPNLVGNPITPEAQRTPANYLNAAAFSLPSYTQPFGNAGRNIARACSLFQLDLGLHKEVRIGEGAKRLQFRAEAFNALNKTNFSAPNTAWNTTAFGSITSTFPARQMQLAFKLLF